MDIPALVNKIIPKPHIVPHKSLAEQLKIDQEKLKNKFEQLYNRWCNPKNRLAKTEGYILVTDFIIKNLNKPLTFAMLVDDVINFKKYFKEEDGDILCFEFCCLCGSEKIIKEIYLQDNEKIKCLTLSDHAIAYALSSDNESLAMQLAKKGAELGKSSPGHISLYSLGNYKAVKYIQDIFTPTNVALEKNKP